MNNHIDVSLRVQEFLKALASETRQAILLDFLNHSTLSVSQISEIQKIGMSTASEHLAILKRGGLLKSKRLGKETYYEPDQNLMLESLDELRTLLLECCRAYETKASD